MEHHRLKDKIQLEVLPRVEKPGRYAGGELNAVVKSSPEVRMALCFPEAYEIGMSSLGFILLYHYINELDWAACERCFAPWPDMEAELRARGLPLYSLETFTPLADFDIVGFSLSYEMTYTNVLTMLDLGGLGMRTTDRGESAPVVIAGGGCAVNPEPLADFIDAFVIGEGEEPLAEALEAARRVKAAGGGRAGILGRLASIDGVYIPSLYDTETGPDGRTVAAATPRAPGPVRRRYVRELDRAYYPSKIILPAIEAVHDRISIEIFRGCVQGCRYCQAGMIYRPRRERDAGFLLDRVKELYRNSGWDEVSLLSLNAPDYSQLARLLEGLGDFANPRRVSISMPSSRIDTFSEEVGEKLRVVRSTGLTLAPEAGTQRLRNVINKRITDDEIVRAVRSSFAAGWKKVKLYFMIGLPTETEEDVLGIARLVERLLELAGAGKKRRKRGKPDFTLSVSNFVPKPHTPFQWEPMDRVETLLEKQRLLRDAVDRRRVKLDFHDARRSALEAVFSRGDRRIGRALEQAWRLGCRFDGWAESLDAATWRDAFERAGIDPDDYAHSPSRPGGTLPWSHIDSGISTKFLLIERAKAMRAETSESCIGGRCTGCGLDCNRQ